MTDIPPCTCTHPFSAHGESGCMVEMCDCLMSLPYGPGIYPDIPHDIYHRLPYVGSTTLKVFRECPASVLLDREATEDMNLGSAIHAWVLEGPRAFWDRFAIRPEVIDPKTNEPMNKNRTDYKDVMAQFERDNSSKTILPAYPRGVDVPTSDVILGIESSLRSHPGAGLLLNQDGLQEVSMIWDDESGVRCKGRIDRDPGRKTLVELKKCADIDRFQQQIANMNYDVAAGHYLNGAEALGIEVEEFVWIGVSHIPPYQVETVFISGDSSSVSYDWWDWSKREAKRLVSLYGECREANNFPAYKLTGVNALAEIAPHQLYHEIEKPRWRN